MRSFFGALVLAVLGVAIGAFVTRAGDAALTLIIVLGGFVPHADPQPHIVAWTLGVHAAAGAIAGFLLAVAVRALSTSRALRRRAPWVMASAVLWTAAGAVILFFSAEWTATPIGRAIAPWLGAIVALCGAVLSLLAVRRSERNGS